MKKWLRISGLIFILLVIVLQFFPGEMPEVITDNPGDITTELELSYGIKNILTASCYDCHSNETNYPWYAKTVPTAWWLSHHIEEGREHLNFSEWAAYSEKDKHEKIEELIEEVGEGEMPMTSYTIIHRSADLSDQQREELVAWAKEYMGELKPGDH